MLFKEYKYLILADYYRVSGAFRWSIFIRHLLFGEVYKYVFWMRTCCFFKSHFLFKYFLYPPARLILERLKYKLGLSIPYQTKIGSGFYIGHFGGIVINASAIIGKNCNISQGVTLGQANRGKNKGYPVIGDNVYIGPGAKIFGSVNIGNNVAIGANCVVNKDIPDNAVVVGVPGRIVSYNGSNDYVNRVDYDKYLFNPSLE